MPCTIRIDGPIEKRAQCMMAGLALLVALPLPSAASGEKLLNPLHFFAGRTESEGTIVVLTKKRRHMRSVGRGRIMADGSLMLVQRVEEPGRPAYDRRWHIRQISPGLFSGTMSEAKGPVTIDEIGGRYRFRFRMKGHLSVEQWLTPLPGGKSVRNTMTIRKFGLAVAHSEGTIRKIH